MKVKELYIESYNQFEDFRLDLTYPLGHPKAEKPLEKVCFIGQSGTGKTSLLNYLQNFLFYSYVSSEDLALKVNGMKIQSGSSVQLLDNVDEEFALHVIYGMGDDDYFRILSSKELGYDKKNLKKCFLNSFPISLFFHTDNIKNIDSLSNSELFDNQDINKFVELSNEESFKEIWQKINEQIISYRQIQIQQSLAISEVTKKIGVKSDDILEAAKKYQEWEQNNPNPLQELADKFLDKLLNRFNLRIRSRLDFEKIEDVKTIKVETLDGQEVPYDFQSTGTRQILLSVLPLYTLKPNRTAIFFDEPERSLYPDIQKEIVELYTSLTTDCQFFYATHSPIIASSFEPWEIVELKFNPETGKVFQELYYEGERHVDNYTINPQYLRWDDILQRVFDLDSEGNEKRVKALMKLATLESKLKKNSIPLEEREKLWEEYLKLSKLTGWTTHFNYEKN